MQIICVIGTHGIKNRQHVREMIIYYVHQNLVLYYTSCRLFYFCGFKKGGFLFIQSSVDKFLCGITPDWRISELFSVKL